VTLEIDILALAPIHSSNVLPAAHQPAKSAATLDLPERKGE